jgi:transposase
MSALRGVLTADQRDQLNCLTRDRSVDAVLALRARLVLWWDDGHSAVQIAEWAGVADKTARLWPARYAESGIDGLHGMPHPGKRRVHDERIRSRILALSRTSPPEHTGLSHWSSREMAKYLKRHEGIEVSHVFVADLWREHGLKPHRQDTFKLSRDRDFAEKVADIVGLYLSPPAAAVVLCVDEKSGVQALDRTQPLLPMTFDRTEKRTHDYVRHGTVNLFGALDVATGKVTGECYPRRGSEEFLAFMKTIAAQYVDCEVHVVVDNLGTHFTAEVRDWLADNPNITFHRTPVGASWINQIEIWFGLITRQAIRRGTFSSVKQLITTIENYIANWNADCKPFSWTADADTILAKVRWIESEVHKLTGH